MADYINGDITGKLYSAKSSVGVVIGPGIFGDREGLSRAARNVSKKSGSPVIVLDPPSHGLNRQEFSVENYAYAMNVAAEYLRAEYGVSKVIGGGHSLGALAGLFASSDDCLDGLIVASLPKDIRTSYPEPILNSISMRILNFLHSLYQSFPNFEGLQMKNFRVSDVDRFRDYVMNFVNAQEMNYDFTSVPKLWLVPGMDAVNKVFSKRDLRELQKVFKPLIGENDEYHEFAKSSHFLNGNRFEIDSAYGLMHPRVQELIVDFISRFK